MSRSQRSSTLVPVRALTPAEQALEAELFAGFENRHLCANHRQNSIDGLLAKIREFHAFAGAPIWFWHPGHMDAWGADMKRSGHKRQTMRGKQGAVRGFLNFVRDPAYPWQDRIAALTGRTVAQICTPENTIRHSRDAATTARRNLNDDELVRFFAASRDHIDRTRRRDYRLAHESYHAGFVLGLVFAARVSEAVTIDVGDFNRAETPEIATYSPFEDLHIRFGKSHDGGPPKPRYVLATAPFADYYATLVRYIQEIRPQLVGPDSGDALLLTARGHRTNFEEQSAAFTRIRKEAGLSKDLTYHCLRHTFETVLHESGLELAVISKLMGHENEATTAVYDHLEPAHIHERVVAHARALRAAADRAHGRTSA